MTSFPSFPGSGLFRRVRDIRRTCWQLHSLFKCGWSGAQLATRVIRDQKALQRKWELIALMGHVRSIRPRVVMEIGTYKGGTLECWAHVCPPTTNFISVDLPGGGFGGGYSEDEAAQFRSSLGRNQKLTCLRMDSHASSTREEILRVLAGREIDFLFIDGDHTYDGVRLDFEMYSPLVRNGGLIALHDVVVHAAHPECRVHEFWRELKDRPSAAELVDRDGFDVWGGIGILYNR